MRTNLSEKIRELQTKPWFYPLVLFLAGLVAYDCVLPWLGFYWDDWEVVFLTNARDPQLLNSYFALDRPFAWPYPVIHFLIGLKPFAWHLLTLLLRWAGVLGIFETLRTLWPGRVATLRWMGLLLLLYPGFFEQSVATAFSRHFTSFALFGISLLLMTRAVTDRGRFWLYMPLAWLTGLLQAFTIEYFVTLELVRPIVLWFLLSRTGSGPGYRKTLTLALYWLPFLIAFGIYLYWRMVYYPSTLATERYAGDVTFMQSFSQSYVAGTLSLITRVFADALYLTVGVWFQAIASPENMDFQAKATWVALAAGALLAGLLARALDVRDDPQGGQGEGEPPDRFHPQAAVLAAAFMLLGGLAIWLTDRQITGGGRWDDRFTLAAMIGSALFAAVLIDWLVRPDRRKWVFVLLLTISLTVQLITTDRFRRDWETQRGYYWQLAWRIPAIEPRTAVFSLGVPAASLPDYDAGFALNLLFFPDGANRKLPVWFFVPDRRLRFSFTPDQDIEHTFRNLWFLGNTSNGIAVLYAPSRGCMRVLDPIYEGDPVFYENFGPLFRISNLERIVTSARPLAPDPDVFGGEPAHAWCYFFQKADLARQMGDWPGVLKLLTEAKSHNLTASTGGEYLPFVEAYARTGQWDQALGLSREAVALTPDLEPLMCRTWSRLSEAAAESARTTLADANRRFRCETASP